MPLCPPACDPTHRFIPPLLSSSVASFVFVLNSTPPATERLSSVEAELAAAEEARLSAAQRHKRELDLARASGEEEAARARELISSLRAQVSQLETQLETSEKKLAASERARASLSRELDAESERARTGVVRLREEVRAHEVTRATLEMLLLQVEALRRSEAELIDRYENSYARLRDAQAALTAAEKRLAETETRAQQERTDNALSKEVEDRRHQDEVEALEKRHAETVEANKKLVALALA